MKRLTTPLRRFASCCIGLWVITGSAAWAETPSSGFLDPAIEAKMEQVKVDDGRKVMRWISADLASGNYNAVMVDRVIFYPAPNPGPQVGSKALEGIADYLTAGLRREIGAITKVVDTGGPGVLRIQPAITAVVIAKEGVSALDIVPVHLVYTAANAATGHMDEDVTTRVEVRITDSVSREYRAAVKTGLQGKQLNNKQDKLSVDDMKQALDTGAAAAARTLQQAL